MIGLDIPTDSTEHGGNATPRLSKWMTMTVMIMAGGCV